MSSKKPTQQEPETQNVKKGVSMSEKKVSTQSEKSPNIENIFSDQLMKDDGMIQGLINLNSLPEFNPQPPPVTGKDFTPGLMGFRWGGGEVKLAIACGHAQVRDIIMPKYIAMVENLHDPDCATIMLQNFEDGSDKRSARGQVLGRINARSSAITIAQGLTGRIIRKLAEAPVFDAYYIDRSDLTAFYIASKVQMSNENQMKTMIAAFDGWRFFDIPLNPLEPYASQQGPA